MLILAATASAIFTAAIGIFGMFMPEKALRLINLDFNPDRPEGKTEVRATLGGLFVCAGLFCVWSQTPEAFGTLGAAWLGAALIRSVFMIPDRSATGINLVSVAVEVFVGIWLILPLVLSTS
jgi:hypothetical protein